MAKSRKKKHQQQTARRREEVKAQRAAGETGQAGVPSGESAPKKQQLKSTPKKATPTPKSKKNQKSTAGQSERKRYLKIALADCLLACGLIGFACMNMKAYGKLLIAGVPAAIFGLISLYMAFRKKK